MNHLNITVEFDARQTGTSTKALGTFLNDPDRTVLVYSRGVKPSDMFKTRIICSRNRNILLPNIWNRIVFLDWAQYSIEDKKAWYNIVYSYRKQITDLYVFTTPSKIWKKSEFNLVKCLKYSMPASNYEYESEYFIRIDTIRELFFKYCQKTLDPDLLYNFATEPSAVLKFCSYMYPENTKFRKIINNDEIFNREIIAWPIDENA